MRVLRCILLITILLFIACSQKNKNKLSVLFDNVSNLEKGAEVKLHGITIGEVTNMELLGDSVLVDIKLNKEQKIPVDSKFSILNPLIGNASVIIEPSEQKVFLKTGDTVKGSYQAKGFLDTFFADSLNKQKAREAIEKITMGLKELSEARKDTQEKQ